MAQDDSRKGSFVDLLQRFIDLSRLCASQRMMVGISGSSPGQCEPMTGISKPSHCCYTSSSPYLDRRRPDDEMFRGFSPFLPQSVGTLTFQGGRGRISLGASTKNQILMLSDKCIHQLHGEDTKRRRLACLIKICAHEMSFVLG